MSRVKIIKDTTLVPVNVNTNGTTRTNLSPDNTFSFLNAKIDKEINRATTREKELEEEIRSLIEERFSVKDVVNTHDDLINYDTSKLIEGDIVIVLVDESLNKATTYYIFKDQNFVLKGNEGSNYYNRDEINSMVNDINSVLDNHEVRITENRNELDNRISEQEAYDILVGND